MTTIRERVMLLLAHKKTSATDFEKEHQLSAEAIRKITNKTRVELFMILKKAYPDLNLQWLLTGKGEMLDKPAQKFSLSVKGDNNKTSQNNGGTTINNYNEVQSQSCDEGRPYYMLDFIEDFSLVENDHVPPHDYIKMPGLNNGNIIWCNYIGGAMSPVINTGDLIALREIRDWRSYIPMGRIYAISTTSGFRTVKVIRKGGSDDLFNLVPANSDYDIEEIAKEAIVSVYAVLGVFRKFS